MERLNEITANEMPTVVFDATGNPSSMAASFGMIAHGGRLVLVGLFQGDVAFHDPDAHRRELTLLCSRNSTGSDFRRIIHHLEASELESVSWISHRAGFGEVVDQFRHWLNPDGQFIKAMIEV